MEDRDEHRGLRLAYEAFVIVVAVIGVTLTLSMIARQRLLEIAVLVGLGLFGVWRMRVGWRQMRRGVR